MKILSFVVLACVAVACYSQESGDKCKKKLDVVFVIDGSASIFTANFELVKTFVKMIAQSFDIGPDGTKIGIIQFSKKRGDVIDHAIVELSLNANEADVITAILALEYQRGKGTFTHLGLQLANEVLLGATYGARDDAMKIAIVVTDGKSTKPEKTEAQAETNLNAGIITYAIGVHKFDKAELIIIASKPTDKHVFTAKQFDELENLGVQIGDNHICPGTCAKKADVIFVLDVSNTIAEFGKIKTFMKDVIKTFIIGPDAVQVGVCVYSNEATTEFFLSGDLEEVNAKVDQITYTGGTRTRTDFGLEHAREIMLAPENGARPGVEKIVMCATDGISYSHTRTEEQAILNHAEGFKTYVFAVGEQTDRWMTELRTIASKPASTFLFTVENYANLVDSLATEFEMKPCPLEEPEPQ